MEKETIFTKLEKFRKENTNNVISVHLYGITISGEYFSIGLEKYINELLKCENIKKLKIYYAEDYNWYGSFFKQYGYASDLFLSVIIRNKYINEVTFDRFWFLKKSFFSANENFTKFNDFTHNCIYIMHTCAKKRK